MAKNVEETINFVNNPDNLMSFGKSFATLNGQPLDKSSIFDHLKEKQEIVAEKGSDITSAEGYAKSASAYVGKIVVVVENNIVTAYVIDHDSTLKPIGDKATMDSFAAKINALQEKDIKHDESISSLVEADIAINGRIDTIDKANITRDSKIAGLEDNFTGNDANNALSLGGHAAVDYQLASELKALAKKDKIAKSDLTTELSAELDAKAVAETVNAELAKKAVKADVDQALGLKAEKTYVDEQLQLKATVVAQEATEAKAQKNKEDIAAMDAAYKAADSGLDEKITGLNTRMGAAESDIDALELKVQNVTNVMDFRGAYDTLPAVEGFDNGDVIVIKMPTDKKKKDIDPNAGKEFVCVEDSGVKSWVEFGNSNANQAAIAALQAKDAKHDESISALETNSATKTELGTLEGKVNKKAEQSDLEAATGRITAVEGEVDTLNAKPAFGISSDQISNWDKEVGAKAIADANKLAIEDADTGLAKAHEKIGVNTAAISKNADDIATKAASVDLTALKEVVEDPATGLAATKTIADQNKLDIAAEKGALAKATANEESLKTKVEQDSFDALNNAVNDSVTGLATRASQEDLNTLSDRVDGHDTKLQGLRTDVDTKQTAAQVNELIAGANISTDKLINGSEIFILNGGAAK